MIITEEQIKEIEKLANNGHAESLIAYGGDLYRNGLIEGAIAMGIGVIVGSSIKGVIEYVKNHKTTSKKESE